MQVGTLTINVKVILELHLRAQTLFGSVSIPRRCNVSIRQMQVELIPTLTDQGETLGLTQQSLDNIGSTVKMLVERVRGDFLLSSLKNQQSVGVISKVKEMLLLQHANDALAKGVPIKISQSPAQPANFYDLQVIRVFQSTKKLMICRSSWSSTVCTWQLTSQSYRLSWAPLDTRTVAIPSDDDTHFTIRCLWTCTRLTRWMQSIYLCRESFLRLARCRGGYIAGYIQITVPVVMSMFIFIAQAILLVCPVENFLQQKVPHSSFSVFQACILEFMIYATGLLEETWQRS